MTTTQIDTQVGEFTEQFQLVKEEISRVIVGNSEIIDGTLISLIAKGHVLLEGIPGIGKTKIVATVADVLHLTFSRIQFTPDLMPGDIVGSDVVHESDTGELITMSTMWIFQNPFIHFKQQRIPILILTC